MIALKSIKKEFITGKNKIMALDQIDLDVQRSEFVLIKGESGSGKSTLLFVLGAMMQPSSGKVIIDRKDIYSMSEKERSFYRAHEIGFVFQSYHLLPYLTVYDNIFLLNKLPGVKVVKDDILEITGQLGIQKRLLHKPSQLSAGEKQRVSLARAMITKPSLILADEPTGNLDEKNTIEVLNYLKKYQQNGGTVVMVTHGNLPDSYATQKIEMAKGNLINSSFNSL